MVDVQDLQVRLRAFAAERDWEQFHSPKNLAMALAVEVGELLEHFQWLTEEQSSELSDEDLARVKEEVADIQIYLLRISDRLGIDLEEAVEEKFGRNAEKYPVELAAGPPRSISPSTAFPISSADPALLTLTACASAQRSTFSSALRTQ